MKKWLSLFMSLLLLLMSVFVPSGLAYATTQKELEQRISDIDSQIAKNKNQLKQLEDRKNEKQEYLDTLEDQISTIGVKVSALEKQIESLDNEIEECNNNIKQLKNDTDIIRNEINTVSHEIKQTKAKIESTKGLLCQKLRSAYMNENRSNLQILMGSKNLADFLTKLEFMKRISEENKRVITEFKETANELEKSKAVLTEKQARLDEKNNEHKKRKKQLAKKKKELVKKQNEYGKTVKQLESNYTEMENYISQLAKNSAIYKNYIEQLQAERAEADAEIDRIIQNYQATKPSTTSSGTTLPASNHIPTQPSNNKPSSSSENGSYSSADSWAWPLGNASCYISSNYGYRDASISGWNFHGGMDITGGNIYGKTVYSTRAGTVVTAIWSTSKKGYGNYVVVDHGDGYMSLYGHCSSLLVTTGQKVSKGQSIAKVGDSGNVTGPHLHFEIRYNGEKQNPANYVKKP